MELPYNIVLCGFMGCGKSTVGKRIARIAGLSFVDMDTYIEKQCGCTISELFSSHGEAYFRDLEHEAARALSREGNKVIATGGGALTFERNVRALKQNGKIVLLDTPLPLIRERLKNDTTRPLLCRPDKDKAMQELHEQRMPVYRAAADIAVLSNATPNQVALAVLRNLGIPCSPKEEG